MSLTLDDLDFLTSGAGEALLERLRVEDLSQQNHLKLVTALRKDYTLDQVRAAVSLAQVRLKARDKFGHLAQKMFFTEDALQQASDPRIRRYRANSVPPRFVVDVCCGIGADSLAFATAGSGVYGIDLDPVRVAMARLNAAVLGLPNTHFEVGDATEIRTADGAVTLFFDPARREEDGRRIYDVEAYNPPLSLVRQWSAHAIAVKLSPGVDLRQLEDYPALIEFISVEGDLKEAVMWLGAGWRTMKATLLTSDGVLHWQRTSEPEARPLSEPRGWLIEPDPALIRAGLVQDAAQHFDGFLLDETIAYFTTDTKPASPWVRAWQILDWMPFNLKKLRAYLRERNVGTVTVKKRGSALTPEGLSADLKLKGDASRTLVLTRYNEQPIVLICADYQP
ncbi:MAG: methyltransferase domain-containing protein [bacterium]|nr:methyltransferase domain-containing protein [bacterium]